jgi:hypothetical protein
MDQKIKNYLQTTKKTHNQKKINQGKTKKFENINTTAFRSSKKASIEKYLQAPDF